MEFRYIGHEISLFTATAILRKIVPVKACRRVQQVKVPTWYSFFQDGSDITYDFHVNITKIPPPPHNTDASSDPQKINELFAKEASKVLSLQDFTNVIPTFFVPLDEILSRLEGYTEEHINTYFSRTKGLQLVSIDGRRFARLYGGGSAINMEDTFAAAESFQEYVVDPALAKPFIAAFKGVTNTWMPLKVLLERAGEDAESELPYKGKEALLYFAQMQHIFGFAADNGGAVLLHDSGFSDLDLDTSPCPATISTIYNEVGAEKVDFELLKERKLSEAYKAEALRFFSSIEECLSRHRKCLYLDKGGTVMRLRTKELDDMKRLSLEDQLEMARQRGDKKRIRILRRKMLVQTNPDNPLLDRDNLAREVMGYVPKTGYVTLVSLVNKQLPMDLRDLLGAEYVRFFKNYPQYFQIFELERATKWCISRPGVPPPLGTLRTTYTEGEALRIVAATCQKMGPTAVSAVMLHLPTGAREYIKKSYANLFNMCTKYPQYFSLVKRSELENFKDSAVLTLIKMPLEISDPEQ